MARRARNRLVGARRTLGRSRRPRLGARRSRITRAGGQRGNAPRPVTAADASSSSGGRQQRLLGAHILAPLQNRMTPSLLEEGSLEGVGSAHAPELLITRRLCFWDRARGGAGDHAARTPDQAEDERRGWQAALGVPLSRRRSRLGTAAGGRVRESRRLQALKIALERLHRRNGRRAQITLSELVEEYLAQHEAAPRTTAKLRWLLAKATRVFGDRRVVELRSDEIGAWRATLPEGHRFEATQALRQ
jgi:hypothetical protein